MLCILSLRHGRPKWMSSGKGLFAGSSEPQSICWKMPCMPAQAMCGAIKPGSRSGPQKISSGSGTSPITRCFFGPLFVRFDGGLRPARTVQSRRIRSGRTSAGPAVFKRCAARVSRTLPPEMRKGDRLHDRGKGPSTRPHTAGTKSDRRRTPSVQHAARSASCSAIESGSSPENRFCSKMGLGQASVSQRRRGRRRSE